VIKIQVCCGCDFCLRDLTMITFITIIGEGLPVVVARHAPDVIELILLKVEVLESFFCVYSLEIIYPLSRLLAPGMSSS
jgi:hypothetical protein